jgi:hypothetical protein
MSIRIPARAYVAISERKNGAAAPFFQTALRYRV